MQKKKNRFLLFIWSLLPGAGEMYLGFMKMGVSLLLGFALLILLPIVTYVDALAVLPAVMYIYSFFHANNLGTLSDEEFYAIKDQYLFGMEGLDGIEKIRVGISTKYKKIAAIILILIGVGMLWNMIYDLLVHIYGWDNFYVTQIRFFMNRIPRVVVAVAVIWIGVRLIRGKKVEDIEDDIERLDITDMRDIAGSRQGAADNQNAADMQDMMDEKNSMNEQFVSDGQNLNSEQIVPDARGSADGQNVPDCQDNTSEQ